MLGSPFQLMEYSNHGPVAYVENQTHSMFLENPEDIRTYRAILAKLKAVTLDEGHSRDLLASLANDYDVRKRPEMEWRKSSYSGATNGGCVEIAFTVEVVGVRDSKDSAGPALRFSPAQWRAFTGRRAPRP